MRIKKYFSKIVGGSISEKEIIELEKLLQNDDDRILFEKFVNDYHDLNLTLQKNDLNAAFTRVLSQIEIKEKPVARFIPNWLKYAAAIIILVVSGYFLTQNQFTTNQEIVEFENSIPSGTNKATLTLEDGSSIALEKGEEYKTEFVESDGEKIVYQSKSNTPVVEIAFNYLTVPRGGEFYIELADNTKVWLNSDSQLKYPVAFIQGQPREVELVYGEAYFDVSPSSSNKGSSFNVVSQGQHIEVLGTEFNIKAYENDTNIETVLVEGSIVIEANGKSRTMIPNEQSILNKESKIIEIKKVDAVYKTAWKSGYLKFRNKSLKEVAKDLERWYNVEFNFKNKELENYEINGVLSKYRNIENFLITLKNTDNIQYEIKNDTIYIR